MVDVPVILWWNYKAGKTYGCGPFASAAQPPAVVPAHGPPAGSIGDTWWLRAIGKGPWHLTWRHRPVLARGLRALSNVVVIKGTPLGTPRPPAKFKGYGAGGSATNVVEPHGSRIFKNSLPHVGATLTWRMSLDLKLESRLLFFVPSMCAGDLGVASVAGRV